MLDSGVPRYRLRYQPKRYDCIPSLHTVFALCSKDSIRQRKLVTNRGKAQFNKKYSTIALKIPWPNEKNTECVANKQQTTN